VKVEPKIIQRDQNRMDLVFEIDEGPLSEVRRISFVGNRRFSDEQLKAEVQTKEARWYRFLSSDDTYDPDRLSFDRELLRRFYLHNGYTDFRVVSAVAELTPNREDFFITFSVDEGERYRFGKIDVVSEIDGLDSSAIAVEPATAEGDWYDSAQIDKSINDITEAVGNLQFAFVEVTPRVRRNKDTLTVDVSYVVSEGRRAFVERIDINGNVRTTDEVIRREFEMVERDPFNIAKLHRSETRVRDLGFFSKVDIAAQEGSQPDLVNIEVNVTEQSTGELTFAAGFSTSDGPLGEISLRERNLLGKGQDLRLRTQISGRSQQIDLSFTEPRFLDRDLAAGFDVFRTSRDNQDESSYDEERTGFGLRLGYPLADALRQTLTYNISQTTVSDVDSTASRVIRDQVGTRIKSSVGQKLVFDQRDSKLFPTEGYLLSISHEVAGLGGDLRFLRSIIEGTYYYPVSEGWVFSLTGEAGSIGGFSQSVPIYERFFLGGSTLRGFKAAGVGPRDTTQGDALGGNRYVRSSAELEFPLGLPEELGVKGRAFVDAGSLDSIDESGAGIVDEFAVRVGTGVGLSWRSPLGLIGLDFGFPLSKETYDETETFRISFGTRF
jgi:outer membrane protein insertion porin family